MRSATTPARRSSRAPLRPRVRLPRARPARQPVPQPGRSRDRSPTRSWRRVATRLRSLRDGRAASRPTTGQARAALDAADIAAIAAGTYRFVISRNACRRRHPRREVPARHLARRRRRFAARSTTTGTTKSRSTTASSRKTRAHRRLRRPAALHARDGRWPHDPGSPGPDPVPRRSSIAAARHPVQSASARRRSRGTRTRSAPGGRHRRLRSLQSVRRAATTRAAVALFHPYTARTDADARPVRRSRPSSPAIQQPAVRTAGRPGRLRARRRISA